MFGLRRSSLGTLSRKEMNAKVVQLRKLVNLLKKDNIRKSRALQLQDKEGSVEVPSGDYGDEGVSAERAAYAEVLVLDPVNGDIKEISEEEMATMNQDTILFVRAWGSHEVVIPFEAPRYQALVDTLARYSPGPDRKAIYEHNTLLNYEQHLTIPAYKNLIWYLRPAWQPLGPKWPMDGGILFLISWVPSPYSYVHRDVMTRLSNHKWEYFGRYEFVLVEAFNAGDWHAQPKEVKISWARAFARNLDRVDRLGCARVNLCIEKAKDVTAEECVAAIQVQEYEIPTVSQILYAWSRGWSLPLVYTMRWIDDDETLQRSLVMEGVSL